MDRRLTPTNGRVAHVSLQGKVEAERFVEGELRQIAGYPYLLDAPGGYRDRQLLWGDDFLVLEQDDHEAFGISLKDGYVGYVSTWGLTDALEVTHRVNVRSTYTRKKADFKYPTHSFLHQNCRVRVDADDGKWARIHLPDTHLTAAQDVFVPSLHLVPLSQVEGDPVQVAERFLGAHYVWAGNSGTGIDCSGLVQAALLACGIACPGDSDQQAALGEEVEGDLRRGDLLFWKGHVAMVVDPTRIIHANAHHMLVVYEEIGAAIERIAAQGDGPVTARRRVVDL